MTNHALLRRRIRAGIVSIAAAALCPIAASANEPAAIPRLYANLAGRSPSPGQWLGSEPLPPELGLPGAAQQIRFVYGSSDGVAGKAVSGAIFFPSGEPPAGGWPIVAWAHGTVGIADHCAPSIAGRSQRDAEYLGAWLREGFAIVATDYQGLGMPGPHPYLDSQGAGRNILDAVRAAQFGIAGLSNRVLIVGQSQGAAAAISAAAMAGQYAPKVGVIGTVATGLPNVEVSLSPANLAARKAGAFDPVVAYLMFVAAAERERDPSIDTGEAILPAAGPLLEAASRSCALPLLMQVKAQGLTQDKAVTPAFFTLFRSSLAAMSYPPLRLDRPLFVGIGEADIDTPPAGQIEIADRARAAGSTVETHLCPGLDHSGVVNPSFRDSSAFARGLLALKRPARRR